MSTPAPAPLSAERLAELAAIIVDPGLEPGPLDVRDLVQALAELIVARQIPGAHDVAWTATPVPSAIASGLRDAAESADQGPLRERLHQAASALDVLCGAITAALVHSGVAGNAVGGLLRAALVTAGAR